MVKALNSGSGNHASTTVQTVSSELGSLKVSLLQHFDNMKKDLLDEIKSHLSNDSRMTNFTNGNRKQKSSSVYTEECSSNKIPCTTFYTETGSDKSKETIVGDKFKETLANTYAYTTGINKKSLHGKNRNSQSGTKSTKHQDLKTEVLILRLKVFCRNF